MHTVRRPAGLDRGAAVQIESLIQVLTDARVQQELTQRGLALRLNVMRNTVARWEEGVVRPLTVHFLRWAAELGYTPALVLPDGRTHITPTAGSPPRIDTDAALRCICIRLRQRRDRLGLIREELAQELGAAENTIRHWECGRGTPELPTLFAWARALGCKLTLARPAGRREPPTAVPHLSLRHADHEPPPRIHTLTTTPPNP